jgi:hypothetical protein
MYGHGVVMHERVDCDRERVAVMNPWESEPGLGGR